MLAQYPLGFGQWLQALAYALAKPREIAIVGDADSADTHALQAVIRDGYRPFQVVALGAPSAQAPAVPLLEDRGLVDGQAAVYVCDAPVPGRAFACQAPVKRVGALRAKSPICAVLLRPTTSPALTQATTWSASSWPCWERLPRTLARSSNRELIRCHCR
jgi:hypothetical protein